jgi:beta-glucosidase
MTLEEKIAFCSGASFWETRGYPQYGIPARFMCDGPHGLRRQAEAADHLGLSASVAATCFPTASALAASWDVDTLRSLGGALGKEALREGVQIILGPGVNMKRNPLCGRNFEYYSEDPLLAGKLAAAWIQGVQGNGVGVSVKHFAANNQEARRMASDSLVDERALREYYLAAFEIAVKEARPATLMCAYNKLNGVYCSGNRTLLWHILREEWGFKGAVMTDWGATDDRIEGFRAGLDLEMPGSRGYFDAEVKAAVLDGRLPEKLVDEAAERLLRVIDATAPREDIRAGLPEGLYEEHHELARRIASECAVLLKNEGPLLPFPENVPLTVIGAFAEKPRFQGTGSSQVTPTRVSSLLEGLREYTRELSYAAGYRLRDEADGGLLAEAVAAARAAAERKGPVLLCLGLTEIYESEGYDRAILSIPKNQIALLEAVSHVNPSVAVVLTGGSAVEMPWLGRVRALLHMHLAGQAGGLAAADLLFGRVNPSGKLAETYPLSYGDVVSSGYYGVNPKQAAYLESMYCGYRYFDTASGKLAEKPVLFPFGYGLSYTSFEYSDLEVKARDGGWEAVFTVKNTGGVAGAEAAQLYIAPRTGGVYRPAHELKGFVKVRLEAGESRRVSLGLERRDLAYFSAEEKGWVVERGAYEVQIGASSRDIRLRGEIEAEGAVPRRSAGSAWYYSLEGKPSKQDFVTIYGEYPDYRPQTKGSYDVTSSIREMAETSLICRFALRVAEKAVARMLGCKVDYSNVLFKMLAETAADNPVRGLPLVAPDQMPRALTEFLVDAANGHFLRGLKRLGGRVLKSRRLFNRVEGGVRKGREKRI